MAPKRLLTFATLLACLIMAAPAAATDSGGVAVELYRGAGGGIVAPASAPPDAAPPAAQPAPPVARPAQDDETPTTPEGEQQPPDEQNGEEQPPADEDGDEETAGPVEPPADDDAGDESASGSLPQTGLELAALSVIGLGLLLAGGALWPTSSWPRPRDRLSRRAPRR